MNLNSLNQHQKRAYDRTTRTIRNLVGSYHSIALRIYTNCDREVTGETVRNWFFTRTIPVDMAFVLYEICDHSIDPLTLAPWLNSYVELKGGPKQAN